MSTTTDHAVRLLTRAEYDRLRASGYAGPVSELLTATQLAWACNRVPATHWALKLIDGATCLVPVQVAR